MLWLWFVLDNVVQASLFSGGYDVESCRRVPDCGGCRCALCRLRGRDFGWCCVWLVLMDVSSSSSVVAGDCCSPRGWFVGNLVWELRDVAIMPCSSFFSMDSVRRILAMWVVVDGGSACLVGLSSDNRRVSAVIKWACCGLLFEVEMNVGDKFCC